MVETIGKLLQPRLRSLTLETGQFSCSMTLGLWVGSSVIVFPMWSDDCCSSTDHFVSVSRERRKVWPKLGTRSALTAGEVGEGMPGLHHGRSLAPMRRWGGMVVGEAVTVCQADPSPSLFNSVAPSQGCQTPR